MPPELPNSPTDPAARLLSLMSVWLEHREAGQRLNPEDLAPETPDLWPLLARQIQAAEQLDPDQPLELSRDDTSYPDSGTTDADLPEAPPGFRLLRFLARGGMGAVYEAIQEKLNRPVALKTLRAGERAPRATVIRFLAEAEVVAAIRHPNVVQIYSFGEHQGRPYLALEYCSGGDLAGRLSGEPFDPLMTAQLLEKLARGVQAAHEEGIVHRDLKPGNILFSEDSEPKIADFGLAKRAASDLTKTQAVMGTLAYMAPEQAAGQAKFVGPQADVWALGVILYECLTGVRPFTGRTHDEVLAAVLQAEPEPPRRRVPRVSRDLEQIVLTCLAKNPSDRYTTAAALAEDLARIQKGEPVSVRPAGRLKRTVTWVRRNPVPTALIVALAALVGVSVLGAYLTQQEAERTRQVQNQRLFESYQARMKLALQRGQGLETLQAYDEAVAAGVTITSDLRLDRAQALEITNQSNACQAELTAINRAELSPARRAQADLLEGDLLIGVDDARATMLLTQAVASGELSEADRFFAQGLLAPKTDDALSFFEKAIDSNAAHIPARAMAGITLFCLGRHQEVVRLCHESKAFAQDHPHFRLLLALAFAFQTNPVAANAEVAKLRALLAGDPGMKEALDAFQGILDLAASLVQVHREGRTPNVIEMFEMGRAMLKIGQAGGTVRKMQDSNQFVMLRLPPCLRQGMRMMISELLNVESRLAGQGLVNPEIQKLIQAIVPDFRVDPSPFQITDEASIAAGREVLKRHPDGFLHLCLAMALYGRGYKNWTQSNGNVISRMQLTEAGLEFEEALKKSSLFGHERTCFLFGALCYAMAGAPTPGHPVNREANQRATAIIRRWWRSPYPPREAYEFPIPIRAVIRGGDYLLALEMLNHLEKISPPNAESCGLRALIDVELKAYQSVLDLLDRAVPDGNYNLNAHSELIHARDQARKALKLLEQVQPPRRVYELAPVPRHRN